MNNMRNYLDLFFWIVLGLILGGAIFFVLGLGVPQTTDGKNITQNQTQNGSVVLPTQVLVTHIITDCEECNSTVYLLNQLDQVGSNYNMEFSVRDVQYDSDEAKSLIQKYGVEKLPTMILSKEASSNTNFTGIWTTRVGTQEEDGSLVYRSYYPPYYKVDTGKIAGMVSAYAINVVGCPECEDVNGYLEYFGGPQAMVFFKNKSILYENDPLAQELIAKYNITKLPSFIASSDLEEYPISETLSNFMSRESDGAFVLRSPLMPYLDLERNHTLVGEVKIKELIDSSCTDCFNVSVLVEGVTSSFSLYISNKTTYDINSTEGKELIKRYNITQVPTIVISPDAADYETFAETWTKNGRDTVESDGWFVYRSHSAVEGLVYRNLTNSSN